MFKELRREIRRLTKHWSQIQVSAFKLMKMWYFDRPIAGTEECDVCTFKAPI